MKLTRLDVLELMLGLSLMAVVAVAFIKLTNQ